VRWVPPPVGGSYHGFRISIAAGEAGARPRTARGGMESEDEDQ